MSDDDIDAVGIVVSPLLHADMALAAAHADKHVYVNQPMARSEGEARAIVDAAKSSVRCGVDGR